MGEFKKKSNVIAAAIAYDEQRDGAPRLLAKGSGSLAQRIIEIAENSGIRIVENRPVGEALQVLSPGTEIPENLYRAVAGILALVYELDGRILRQKD